MKKFLKHLLLAAAVVPVLAQNTAVYPSAVANYGNLLLTSPNATTTVTASVGAGDTTINVASTSAFPTLSGTKATAVVIDAEAIKICSMTSNTMTVCASGRGFDNTTATSHNKNATVSGAILAYHQLQLAAETIALETWNMRVANILGFGATCDGSDQNTAVQAAIAAGARQILIPAGCTWIAPSGAISAGSGNGITYIGEDWKTSIIKSSATPSGLPLTAQPGVTLQNINAEGSGCNLPGGICPIKYWTNASDLTASVVSTGYGTFHSVSGITGVDITGGFFQTEDGLGDGLNATAIGVASGNALRTDCYDSCAASISNVRENQNPGIYMTDVNAGHGPVPNTGPSLKMYTNIRTSGNFIFIDHQLTTDTGDVVLANMADGTGSFTGNFLTYEVNGAVRSQIQNNGSIYTTGQFIANPFGVVLANGANQNIGTSGAGVVTISGPTGAFSVGGLSAGTSGSTLWVINTTSQIMTVNNQDAGSSATNRIFVPGNANFACTHGFCAVQLIYTGSQWQLLAPAST